MKKLLFTLPATVLAIAIMLFGCSKPDEFTDKRDGNVYKTVKIGEQVWMAENLNYNTNTDGSKCYDNKAENCDKYGRLYDWAMALKACPSGWHLPSNEEWDVLYKFVDSGYVVEDKHSKVAGKYLKATSGWNEGVNGLDIYGFAALPGGYGGSNGYFSRVGERLLVKCYGEWCQLRLLPAHLRQRVRHPERCL